MDSGALLLVLISAFMHSGWNYMAKRSQDQGIFLWLAITAGAIIYAPAFFILLPHNPVSGKGWIFIAASAVIHVFYFVFLGGALSRGHLSFVYPLARGIAPLFVLVLSYGFMGEIPNIAGGVGVFLVIAGVALLGTQGQTISGIMRTLQRRRLSSGALLALLTGLTIGIYSVIDKGGVSLVNPLIYMWLWVVGSVFLMAPHHLRSYTRVRLVVKTEYLWVIVAGILLFGAYTMVLAAMNLTIVTYAAAMRETSILIATLYGAVLLKEHVSRARIAGILILLLGVALIGIFG